MKRFKWQGILIGLFLVCNLAATGGLAVQVRSLLEKQEAYRPNTESEFPFQTAGKYTLYIGTNDKDTYTQLIPTEEAQDIVNEICSRHVGGYTSFSASGGWVDETGTLTEEETLVYFFYDVTEEQIKAIMDEVKTSLNQNSILIEEEKTRSAYY